MNYGKAKKILIFLFVFVDLFLIWLLVGISGGQNKLSPESTEKVIELAKQKNLELTEKEIPKRVEMLDFLELESLSEVKDFIKKTQINVKSESEKDVLKGLNKNGFKDYTLLFYAKEENEITGDIKYKFQQTYNGYVLQGSELFAIVSKDNITEISGTLFNVKSVNYSDFDTVSPLQILLDVTANNSGKGEKITKISQGYYIPHDSLEFTNLTAIPCYVLELSKGKMFYDAVNGEFLMYSPKTGNNIYNKQEAFLSL